jgi:hypothetical protein
VRVIALLLAAVMMVGVVGQVAFASEELVCAVEEAPDIDTPGVLESVTPARERRRPGPVEGSMTSTYGRMHAVLVFRPPRGVASR